MSDPLRVVLVGATGLVGRNFLNMAAVREDMRLTAIARRETPLPSGARMEMFVAETDKWSEVLESVRPQVLVCALGTTWKKAGESEANFRAVDQTLVCETARAAHRAGVERMVTVSSVGADAKSRNFYLRVKGEADEELATIGFKRLDILRPGLLRGHREGDRRFAERMGIAISPLTNLLLHGKARRFRAIRATTVAEAALTLCLRKAGGRFIHDNDGIRLAARQFAKSGGRAGNAG